jgi:hypothetical protein
MERSLLDKLKGVYKVPIKTDKFGRREALPSEIQSVIEPKFPQDLDSYLPTEGDIYLKVETKKYGKT